MDIAVIGINYHESPIAIREAVAFTESMRIEASNLLLDEGISEIVIVSTCSRSEIYIATTEIRQAVSKVCQFYEHYFQREDLAPYLFTKNGSEACRHLFRVTAGLDSIVLGEDQILAQVKTAYESAQQVGAVHKVLNHLFQQALATSKEIKNTTKISEQALSLSYLAVQQLKQRWPKMVGKRGLLIGAGTMTKLALENLLAEEVDCLYISNRSFEKIKDCMQYDARLQPIPYAERYAYLTKVDFVISATACPHTILKAEHCPPIEQKLFILDLALPRDVDTALVAKENIEVWDLDDLKQMSAANAKRREDLAKVGEEIVEEQVANFCQWYQQLRVDPIIQALNQRCQTIKEDTFAYLTKKLTLKHKEEKLLDKMLTSALKRVIREPILHLKECADTEQQSAAVRLFQQFFELEEGKESTSLQEETKNK